MASRDPFLLCFVPKSHDVWPLQARPKPPVPPLPADHVPAKAFSGRQADARPSRLTQEEEAQLRHWLRSSRAVRVKDGARTRHSETTPSHTLEVEVLKGSPLSGTSKPTLVAVQAQEVVRLLFASASGPMPGHKKVGYGRLSDGLALVGDIM